MTRNSVWNVSCSLFYKENHRSCIKSLILTSGSNITVVEKLRQMCYMESKNTDRRHVTKLQCHWTSDLFLKFAIQQPTAYTYTRTYVLKTHGHTNGYLLYFYNLCIYCTVPKTIKLDTTLLISGEYQKLLDIRDLWVEIKTHYFKRRKIAFNQNTW